MARQDKFNNIFNQCPNSKINNDYCNDHDEYSDRIDKPIPITSVELLLKSYIYENKEIKDKTKQFKYAELFPNKNLDEIMTLVSGPAYYNKLLAHNDVDPISQEDIWTINDNGEKVVSEEIPDLHIFSYLDQQGFIQCFNIHSLCGLFNENIYKHPVTANDFSEQTIQYAKIKMELLNIKNVKNTNLDIKQLTFNVFYKFHKFNIYPKDNWFLDLDQKQLAKMYYETKDFYIHNVKQIINDPNTFFEQKHTTITNMENNNANKIKIQKILLDNIDKLMSINHDMSLQTLCAYIIIGGLATVCVEAKEIYSYISYSFM
jgi:hypothetical protein